MKQLALVVLALAILIMLTAIVYQNHRRFHRPLLTTSHQAVTLTNGSVFYGRLHHLGSDHPVLRDALTVRVEADAASPQQPHYVLVKHRDGPTGADHLILPAASIAWVEPVHPDSIIGRLIAQGGT